MTARMDTLPPPPSVTFASDNAAGVHPEVMAALASANAGHAIAYGNDRWTAELTSVMRERFGAPVEVLPVWGGTGANVVSLACVASVSDAVICTDSAHIHVDEAGAPERLAGTKLLALPSADGKLRPAQLREHLSWLGDEHHPQPRIVSVTQSTELGTLYTADELGALCEEAHRHGMVVHMDGARIANATAALGGDLRSFTIGAGVDVISFGGTKNGMMYGEAIVFCRTDLATRAPFVRKQLAQLPSKARFISAQLLALLRDDLWLRLARHANEMSALLGDRVAAVPGVRLEQPPVVNSLFPLLPRAAIEPLQAWCPFYVWDEARAQARWMTAWDTTPDDVERFAAGVRAVIDALSHG
jgi:threonine aldolase